MAVENHYCNWNTSSKDASSIAMLVYRSAHPTDVPGAFWNIFHIHDSGHQWFWEIPLKCNQKQPAFSTGIKVQRDPFGTVPASKYFLNTLSPQNHGSMENGRI